MRRVHITSLQLTTRKVAILLLVTFLVATFVFYFGYLKDNKKAVLSPSKVYSTVADEKPDVQRYEAAITQGLNYLDHNASGVSPLQWLIIDYLQRTYSLDPKFSALQRDIKPAASTDDAADERIFRRIIEPDKLVDTLPVNGATPLRQMLMEAAHCDHIPLPTTYNELLNQNVNAGEYNLTHVAFTLKLLQDNGCKLPGDQDKQLREKVVTGMVKLADQPDISQDLRYESVAFLQLLGRRDLVSTRWINRIAIAQRMDGGWAILAQDNQSSDHATVVALWALLQYARPTIPNAPIIRRPPVVSH